MILEQFLNKKAEEIDNPIRNWGVGFTAEVINEWINLQIQVKKLAIPAVSDNCSCGVKYIETKKSDIPYDTNDNVYHTDIIIYHCPKCGNIDKIKEY